MLAGRVRLKTFLILAIGLVVIVAVASALIRSDDDETPSITEVPPVARVAPAPVRPPVRESAPEPRPNPDPERPAPRVTEPAPVVAVTPPAPSKPPAVTVPEYERVILAQVGQRLGSSKVKDVFKGRSYKINLYQDDGHSTVNRAKVDLDRDDKWDEKWTFDVGRISKQVAPDDDENYTRTFVRQGDTWIED